MGLRQWQQQQGQPRWHGLWSFDSDKSNKDNHGDIDDNTAYGSDNSSKDNHGDSDDNTAYGPYGSDNSSKDNEGDIEASRSGVAVNNNITTVVWTTLSMTLTTIVLLTTVALPLTIIILPTVAVLDNNSDVGNTTTLIPRYLHTGEY